MENFTIRPILPEDASSFWGLIHRNRERLKKYFPITTDAIQGMDSALSFIIKRLELSEQSSSYAFVIEQISPKEIVGYISIKSIDWKSGKGELAYYVSKDHEGKGLTSFAVAKIISIGFGQLGLNKLYARVGKENIGSHRVLKKNGFDLEGVLRKDYRNGEGALVDVHYYGIINEAIGVKS